MSEELLGPDIRCVFSGPPDILDSVKASVSESDNEVKAELAERLMDRVREHIDHLLVITQYVHDGYSLSWELLSLDDFEGEISMATSFNVHVKSDDFEFFDRVLNKREVLGEILHRIEKELLGFLKTSGVSFDKLGVTMESGGFGYG